MASFAGKLTADEAEAVRSYILFRANEDAAPASAN
jgi:hypothetical protein